VDDNYYKRKGLDDFIKQNQNVGSFDDLASAIESSPKVVKPDDLMGHLLMESSGATEDDPKLLGKLRDTMYQDSDIQPTEIKLSRKLDNDNPKAIAQYKPDAKVIEMKIDADPLQKASSYAHEVGHHMDDMVGKGSIDINSFPDEKIAEFVKNNPNASDMDLQKFMDSVKKYGMESDAAAALSPMASRELQTTLHHEGAPRGFEMQKVYDIMKGAGKNAKVIGKGITKIGAKALGPVAIGMGLANGDASAAIPGMWSEDVGEGSDQVPQLSKDENEQFKSLKERLESEE